VEGHQENFILDVLRGRQKHGMHYEADLLT
jgi:hypothetical protein